MLQCELCSEVLKKGEWIRLPCDHYIHKKCFNKICNDCPRCDEDIFNASQGIYRNPINKDLLKKHKQETPIDKTIRKIVKY